MKHLVKSWLIESVRGLLDSDNDANARTSAKSVGPSTWRPKFEPLESRNLLSSVPDPITPDAGEQALLDVANFFEEVGNIGSLNLLPVPYTISTSVGGVPTLVQNAKAGQSVKIDVDQDKSTGKGGSDLIVELNTVLLPDPHIEVSFERLGNGPFVEDFEILVSFPFEAFTGELLPSTPNLFLGFKTTAADGAPGGHAPENLTIEFVPGVMAGTDHLYDMHFTASGSDNPLTYLMGHFDGDFLIGLLNSSAIGINVETADGDVADDLQVGLGVTSALVGAGDFQTTFDLDWVASEVADVEFSFLEAEDLSIADNDFGTTLNVSNMPTEETLSVNFTTNSFLTLSHRGNSVIDDMTYRHERRDGASFTVSAQDVPTQVDVSASMSLGGDTALVFNVNDNTMDLQLEAVGGSGFPNTADLLGIDLSYLSLEVDDAVDMFAGFISQLPIIDGGVDIDRNGMIDEFDDGYFGGIGVIDGAVDLNLDEMINGDDSDFIFGQNIIAGGVDVDRNGMIDAADDGYFSGIFSASAFNPGESIARMQIVADDDAHYETITDQLVGLELAPDWNDPARHVISFVEDGEHGTVAARLLNFKAALFDLNAMDLTESFRLITSQAAPLQSYLRFGEGSTFLPEDPNDYIEFTCDVFDLPAGEVRLNLQPPSQFGYEIDPPTQIDTIHCYGNIGLTNFDVLVGDLPARLVFEFDPTAHARLVAEDGMGNPAQIGQFATRMWSTSIALVAGKVDLNLDGEIDENDTGMLLGQNIIEGMVDTDGSGAIDENDDGTFLKLDVIDGGIDYTDNGVVDNDDNAAIEDLSMGVDSGEGLFSEPLRDVRLRMDDMPSFIAQFGGIGSMPFDAASGSAPPLAGAIVHDTMTNATAVVLNDGPNREAGELIVGRAQGTGFGDDNALELLASLVFRGQVKPFAVGDVLVGASSGATAIVRRVDQFDGKGTVYLSDISASFENGEALLVGGLVRAVADGTVVSGGNWMALVNGIPSANGMVVQVDTEGQDVYLGGLQLAVSTAVMFDDPLPEPDPALAQSIQLTELRSTVEAELPPATLAFSLFGLDRITYVQNLETSSLIYNADFARPLKVEIHRDFGGAFFEDDGDKAIDLDMLIQDLPATIELFTSPSRTFYNASSPIDLIAIDAVIDELNDGGPQNYTIVLGEVDINDDGVVDGTDNGIYEDFTVIAGRLDLNGDGMTDIADNGVLGGAIILGGRVDVNANGLIDFNDNILRNGTEFDLHLMLLPDQIDARFAPSSLSLIDGLINIFTEDQTEESPDPKINGKDKGEFFGVSVANGRFDIDGNGMIDGDDDGFVLDVRVIDGKVDLNDDGVVNGDDDGALSGVHLSQSAGIESVAAHARAIDGAYGVFGMELRVFSFEAEDIPADLFYVSTPHRTRLTASDEVGDPAVFGSLDVFAASTLDPAQLDQRTSIFFTAADPQLGDILTDGQLPALVDYSPFTQAIDYRYHDEGGTEGVIDRLRTVYSLQHTLDTDEDHIAARLYGGTPDFLSIHLEGFQEAAYSQSYTTYEVIGLDPIELPATFDVVLYAPSNGERPLYIGLGQSSGAISELDHGRFDGYRVIGGKVDVNDDGEITEDDDGSAGGFAVINGRLDTNDDANVNDQDDLFVDGMRIVNGNLDLSETATIAYIENVPDTFEVRYRLTEGMLSIEATDDVNASAGDVDVYIGPLFSAKETDAVTRLLLFDTPESVEVKWGLGLLNGGILVDSSNAFEVLGLIQQKADDGSVGRNVFGLTLEDFQIGYDVEFFSFDAVESVEFSFGVDIINGRFDMNDDGAIDEDDDGVVGGFLGIGDIDVIDGELDINNNGSIDDGDDGVVGVFPVYDGRADVNFDGMTNGDDDFAALSIELDTAWELFSAEIGLDNDAEDTDIGGNADKAPISGFLLTYTLTDDPEALDSAGPAPDGREYLPGISLMLDGFREASFEQSVWLDPFTPNVPGLPFQVNPLTAVFEGNLTFDYWIPFEVDVQFTIDFPDWVPLDDITVGIVNAFDYTDNTPLHLLPLTGFFVGNPEELLFTWLGFHEFGDHSDPYD